MAGLPTYLPALFHRLASESLAQASDRQLLERFTDADDEAAFAAILDRHGPMLHGLCRRWLGDVHRADDVLQATFLVLVRRAHAIRRRDNLAGWLYRVAQRLARDLRRDEAARARRERQAARARAAATPDDPGYDELVRILVDELHQVSERYQLPLLMCYLEGRTQDEAAKLLGWSLSTLRRRLERGRDLLRARMLRRGVTLGTGLLAQALAPPIARASLPEALRWAILDTARAGATGSAVSASVAGLANGTMTMAGGLKVFVWSALLLALGGVLAGACWWPAQWAS